MLIEELLSQELSKGLFALYKLDVPPVQLVFQKTKKEFEGDLTLVVFPFVKASRKAPEETALEIGTYLAGHLTEVSTFNAVKGFLNIVVSTDYWLTYFKGVEKQKDYAIRPVNETGDKVMVEYSSPNTNKPLHLGHIRNNLLGFSIAEILKAGGKQVVKATLVNDRGIHICKSMLAWKKWGAGETPDNTSDTACRKGDHLVGKYYVLFDKEFKVQSSKLLEQGMSKEDAEKKAPIILEVQEMLRKWEEGDPEVRTLWTLMNGWVYKGFESTYRTLGVDFDKTYYESETYLLGKKIIEQGLRKYVFEKKADHSVRIDLTADGLDEKVLLRPDGTSVYMTQDLGTAVQRFSESPDLNRLIYVVGSEQDYHFKVLFLILKKLGYKWAEDCFHLSYGMVELPEGRMKSREGTVVDADDLIKEMIDTAREMTLELGKTEFSDPAEAEELYRKIGLGALKYFMLKVDPKKKMLFNPKESIDLQGNTGPFIQYAYTRIRSILRKSELADGYLSWTADFIPEQKEKELIKLIYSFPAVIQEAGNSFNPGTIANFVYELAREYNHFYQDCPILKQESVSRRNFRLSLSAKTAEVISFSMKLLGIEVPERM